MHAKTPIRFITAASLFDGHDAAIHIMRRILQDQGAEVIHLGHNRSVADVVNASIQEDVQGVAVSSYQGGHVEYFTYMLERLKALGGAGIHVFGGGGGVITDEEIELLQSRGVKRIFSPAEGLRLGLVGMIKSMLDECRQNPSPPMDTLKTSRTADIARSITTLELGADPEAAVEYVKARQHLLEALKHTQAKNPAQVVGITGTGGAGKSTLIDELVTRFLLCFPEKKVAILSIDPTKIKTGGACLGDRIRFNCASSERVFVRSMATRRANLSTSATAKEILQYLSICDFDLVILETSGIGQSDSEVKDLAGLSIYVMTPEYGARGQLEKIDMLDHAHLVAINKFDKAGALDALRDVRKTFQRNHHLFDSPVENMPVYPTSAHLFGDLGTNVFFNRMMELVKKNESGGRNWSYEKLPEGEAGSHSLIPKNRTRYLSQISETVSQHHRFIDEQAELYDRLEHLTATKRELPTLAATIDNHIATIASKIDPTLAQNIKRYQEEATKYENGTVSYEVRGQQIPVQNFTESMSHLPILKVVAPKFSTAGEMARFVGRENLPGYFPFTAGVYPFKRENEDPTRMFAGEGGPERTNKRFHYLCLEHTAKRLSTAFDSVTLYGENPDLRPDIYGKVGNAGVSICTVDDAKRLYSGFDLTSPEVSVSMTINGPAPTILAFFLNAAIDSACERELKKQGAWENTQTKIARFLSERKIKPVVYRSEIPQGHDGSGLGFLGVPASMVVDPQLYASIKKHVLQNVRGTIQADILKEDQAQNTCIFSTEFSLAMMGDMQEYFIKNNVNNFYSVSISGYHIAEAGANPISQLAFTLANGFTLLEYYKSRGMHVDDFAKNFSFFFSNGIDPEYAVIGRVARRIWAIALKNIYQGNVRSQMLKYHVQTSGRSLHAQEMTFNDIRTTLEALYAIADNCNSLHTNAFDEAITTPTESSVRQAVAIQMIINHELGLTKNQNPLQGSYFIEYLTNLVERKVLQVFENLDARGGVLGAMETMYQRGQIQEESMYYEQQKHSGNLKIIGVNTFLNHHRQDEEPKEHTLMRSSDEEKAVQVEQVTQMKNRFPKEKAAAIKELMQAAQSQQNTFEKLLEAAKYATLGEITQAFFAVGGEYRRSL
jgi:methylmalonyl-CoA mutase